MNEDAHDVEQVDFSEVRKRLYLEELKERHRKRMFWWRARWATVGLLLFLIGWVSHGVFEAVA